MNTITRIMRRKSVRLRVWKTLNAVVGVVTILNVSMIAAALPSQVKATPPPDAGSGSIWTTTSACGADIQDKNHFKVDDHVYINYSGFNEGSYVWEISGKPGHASGDPGMVVKSATEYVGSTGIGCFDAYTIAGDDWGEYQVKMGTKGDNYRVDGTTVGSLVLTKIVDTGLANADSFSFTISPDPQSVGTINTIGGMYSFEGLTAGSYTITELPKTGYHQVSTTCTRIAVAAGQQASCEIHNALDVGTVTVKKIVVNDDKGSKDDLDFTMHIKDGATDVVTPFAGDKHGTMYSLPAGTYTISENDPTASGYQQESIECDKLPTGTVTVTNGSDHTCVITNNDIAPQLTVIKHVINDNGGVKEANDFKMHVIASGVSDPNFNGDEKGTTVTLHQGTYSVFENGLPGYAMSAYNGCSGMIYVGEHKTCTITNIDMQPTLKVVKVVSGGTKQVSDFPLFVDATPVKSDETNYFDKGTYTVRETSDPSYASAFSGDCDASGKVTLEIGDHLKTCTITNTYIPTRPNLTITKTDNRATAQPGETLTYEIAVTNSGDMTAYNVRVDDTLPSFIGTPTDVTPAADTSTSGHLIWNNLTINGHDSKVLTFKATINASMPSGTTVLHNEAALMCSVRPTTNNLIFSVAPIVPTCQAEPAVDETNVTAVPTIDLTKTGPATVAAGDDITYTMTWSVGGNAPTSNLTLTDPLPTNTTFVSADNGGTYNTATKTITWLLGTKNPGDSGTVTLIVKSDSPLDVGTVITNTATLDTDQTDPISKTWPTTTTGAPVLSLTKAVDDTTLAPNQTVNYTINWSVSGNSKATNVILTDSLPATLNFVSTDNGGTYDIATRTITWNLGTKNPGQSGSVTVVTTTFSTMANGITITNNAAIKSAQTDPLFASTVSTAVVPQVLGAATQPILSITKTANVSSAKTGSTIAYSITIKNTGDGDATNVVVTDTLPAGLSFIGTTDTTATWDVGTLSPDQSRTLAVDATVKGTATGSQVNTASATADNVDAVEATATVKVPSVLGLSTTGAGILDYLIALMGAGCIALGAFGLKKRGATK